MLCLITVLISLRRVICLSQWFITLCLWLYCISITKKSDTSITVIYHAMSDYCINITKKSDMSITVIYHGMSLTVLYHYRQDEWYVCHSDLSCCVSDCTVVGASLLKLESPHDEKNVKKWWLIIPPISRKRKSPLLICLNTRKIDIMTLEIQILAWNVFRHFRPFRQCSEFSESTDFFRISKHKNWFIQNFLTL